MLRTLISSAATILLLVQPAQAQDPVWYEVDLANAAHHEARITVTYPDLPEAGTLELWMSRSSPGRYALHEFAKNVYAVEAVDGMERALSVTRPSPYQWNVNHPAGTVKVTYTLFADRADGTYAGIDRSQAHLNSPATYMWARGQEDRPIRVDFRPPEGANWGVATQLPPEGGNRYSFTAPSLAYLLDSPTHLGSIEFRDWRTSDGQQIRLAVDHRGTDGELDEFEQGVRAIVTVTGDVYGGFPTFDYGEYTFISAYLPWVSGDGMEHRNSTSLTSTGTLRSNALGLLGTVAHEFFHAWNVERMRPSTLEPFDFERENMSAELWFAEGFTSYYTNVLLRRAGLIDDDGFARRIGGTISTVTNSPGRHFRSPIEMSMHAPHVDNAVSVDPTNENNTFISYYTWGSGVGLGLDLALRDSFGSVGLSADAYMRAAWERFGISETTYDVDDLEVLLADLTGDPAWAKGFFDEYVRGRQVPPYAELLAHAGMILRPRNPEGPWVGPMSLRDGPDGVVVVSTTLIGSPIYVAGVDRLDRITNLDGKAVTTAAQFNELWRAMSPGDEVDLAYVSRGQTLNAVLTVGTDPRLEVVTAESQGQPVDDAARAFRASWLNGN